MELFAEALRWIINESGTVLSWAVFFVLFWCVVELIFVRLEDKHYGRGKR